MNEKQNALQRELDALNAEVQAVLAKRKAWMDAHMAEFARVPVGEEIYDLKTGQKLGTVTKHYRYWDEQQNPLYDTSMSVECEFEVRPNTYDNTSRHAGALWYGTRADLKAKVASDMRSLST